MELIKYSIIIIFLIIIISITLYIRNNSKPEGSSKKNTILASIVLVLIITSTVHQCRNPPLPNVSYKFIQSKKETIKVLMSDITKDVSAPIDTREYAKQVGLASLSYSYEGTNLETMNNIVSNIQSSSKWIEISLSNHHDSEIQKIFCYGEFTLNLYNDSVNINWNRENYCFKKENGEL